MTKLKKLKYGLYSSIGLSILVVVVAIGSMVNAFGGTANTVMENVTIANFNQTQPELQNETFGALTSPDINYPYLSVNGDRVWHLRGDMIDASTTVVSIDPTKYGISVSASTTVVEMARLRIDGVATSTFTVACGASATAYAAPTYNLLSSGSVATSTHANEIIENNLLTAGNGNSLGVDGGAIDKIALTPNYPYFVCTVTTLYSGAFTEVTNTFDGDFLVRISQMQ